MHELEDARAACREKHNIKHDKKCRQCSQLFICLRNIGELNTEVMAEMDRREERRAMKAGRFGTSLKRDMAMAENFHRIYGGTEASYT